MPTLSELYGDSTYRCSAAISNSYDSCGTVTRANVAYAVPEGLDEIFQDSGVYRDMKSLLTSNLELKACGVKQSGLYDWLMSSARGVGKLVNIKRVKGTDSLMEPFILATQKSVINSEYWAISEGWNGNSGAYVGPLGVTPGSAAQRIVRVISRNDLEGDQKWFTPNGTVHIFSRTTGGTALRGAWGIADSDVAADGTYVDILLNSQNAGSTTPYDATPGQTVNRYFHAGVLVIGTNNVNDFESWCYNRPALNPNRMVPFWFQTSRYTLCVDEWYKEWLAYLMDRNPLFAKFGDVPIAERNRQLGAEWQKEFIRSFFWGKPLNANQTLAGWKSLPQINSVTSSIFDTGTETDLVAYRANSVGVYEQLRQCGRVKDLQGQQLNLEEFFTEIYNIKRSRESQGKNASQIDVYTDSWTAYQFQQAMIEYYGNRTGNRISFDYDVTNTTMLPSLGFNVRSYELLYPQGTRLNIITDKFFDDFLSAAQTEADANGQNDFPNAFRFLMVLDLGGSIYPGIIASNRKVHTVGELEALAKIDQTYGCTMKNPTKEITMNSTTWTTIVECPSDSLIVENFSSGEPSAGDQTSPYDDLYESPAWEDPGDLQ